MRGRVLLVSTVAFLAVMLLAGTAMAAEDGSAPPQAPVVKGKIITRAPDRVLPAPPETLPLTGAQLSGFLVLGLVAVSAGLVLVRMGRKEGVPAP